MSASAFFNFSESVEIESRVGIDIIDGVSSIVGFGTEEEHENPLDGDEGQKDVEVVVPSQVGSDRACNDGDTVGDGGKHEVDNGDTNTTLVNEIEITNCSNND